MARDDDKGCDCETCTALVEGPTPPDLFDAEPGEAEAAVEETIAHLNAGEAGKWGEHAD